MPLGPEDTQIAIKKTTKYYIQSLGRKGETYDDLILKHAQFYEKYAHKLLPRRALKA